MRGIEKPIAYLVKLGFSQHTANKISTGMIKELNVSHIEKLCRALKCVPDDLFEWTGNEENAEGNLLERLRRNKVNLNLNEKLAGMTLDEITELMKKITTNVKIDSPD